MNVQDFTKQWEAATEALKATDSVALSVRSSLTAGSSRVYTKNFCIDYNDGRYCDVENERGQTIDTYNCTKTWTKSPC